MGKDILGDVLGQLPAAQGKSEGKGEEGNKGQEEKPAEEKAGGEGGQGSQSSKKTGKTSHQYCDEFQKKFGKRA